MPCSSWDTSAAPGRDSRSISHLEFATSEARLQRSHPHGKKMASSASLTQETFGRGFAVARFCPRTAVTELVVSAASAEFAAATQEVSCSLQLDRNHIHTHSSHVQSQQLLTVLLPFHLAPPSIRLTQHRSHPPAFPD